MSNTSEFIDIDLSPIRKKRIRIDGDDSRILELNTSDLNMVKRLDEVYPKMCNLAKKVGDILPDESEEPTDDVALKALSEAVDSIDKEMRELLDYLFDSNVSEMCAPFGNLYDPINGQLRFEYIIDTLVNVYEDDLDKEYKAMKKRINSKTQKYTKK